VERPRGIDQGELKVIVLQGDDHRARVQAEDLGKIGAGDAPVFACGDGLLLQEGQQVTGPVHLDPGNQVRTQPVNFVEQLAPFLDAVQSAGVLAAIFVDVEVGSSGLQEGLVLGGLDVPALGIQVLPRGQGLEDGVGQGDDLIQGDAGNEPV